MSAIEDWTDAPWTEHHPLQREHQLPWLVANIDGREGKTQELTQVKVENTLDPVEAVLLGAGERGMGAYGAYALENPGQVRFVAVAEPNDERRALFAQSHGIPEGRCFRGWEDLLAAGQLAPALLCCTLDVMHAAPTLAALELGYHVLLEKPMSPSLAESTQLVLAAERAERLLFVCHVLRYTSFFSALHEVLASGRLGDIVSVEHRENVLYAHMAHSFVRGNWRNAVLESPMILQKCCHDLDILVWNLGLPTQLHSFGSLVHYRAANAPQAAPARCLDGCPAANECNFYAPRLYLGEKAPLTAFRNVLGRGPDAWLRALQTGPYGRCVYRCDNDVVDNQTVTLRYPNGATAVLVMHGHSHREGRTMRYDGTRASLRGALYEDFMEFTIHDHLTGKVETVTPSSGAAGHGGGDAGVMNAFVASLRHPRPLQAAALTSGRASLASHLLAFAAEESRLTERVIDVHAFQAAALAGVANSA